VKGYDTSELIKTLEVAKPRVQTRGHVAVDSWLHLARRTSAVEENLMPSRLDEAEKDPVRRWGSLTTLGKVRDAIFALGISIASIAWD